MQLTYLTPGEIVRAFDTCCGISNAVAGQEDRCRKAALLQHRECIRIEILVAIVKGEHNGLGQIPPGRESIHHFWKINRAIAGMAEPPHLQRKHRGGRIDLMVGM